LSDELHRKLLIDRGLLRPPLLLRPARSFRIHKRLANLSSDISTDRLIVVHSTGQPPPGDNSRIPHLPSPSSSESLVANKKKNVSAAISSNQIPLNLMKSPQSGDLLETQGKMRWTSKPELEVVD
jgi:hypothetical protein